VIVLAFVRREGGFTVGVEDEMCRSGWPRNGMDRLWERDGCMDGCLMEEQVSC